jgi:hypothetical protein
LVHGPKKADAHYMGDESAAREQSIKNCTGIMMQRPVEVTPPSEGSVDYGERPGCGEKEPTVTNKYKWHYHKRKQQ